MIAAAIVSLLGHFAVGAAKSLVTIRSWWSSGLEMTLIGVIVGAVTYAVGFSGGCCLTQRWNPCRNENPAPIS